MTVTLHFRGGPRDGEIHASPSAPDSYYFPVAPPIVMDADPDAPLPPPTMLIYTREPGVVAHEAVYTYWGEA